MITKKILILSFVWPEPRSSAAGVRTLALCEYLLSQNFSKILNQVKDKNFARETNVAHNVELHFASTASKNTHSLSLEALGVHTHEIQVNEESFDHFIAELKPDWVIFDRFTIEEQFGWRVKQVIPEALLILDLIDLHHLRHLRMTDAKVKTKLDSLTEQNRELASMLRVDINLVISDFEYQYLLNEFNFPKHLLLLTPLGLDFRLLKNNYEYLPENREHFVFVGNYRHPPNHHAANLLAKEIWPKIKVQLPSNAQLHLYGAYAPKEIADLQNTKLGIYFKGQCEDIHECLSQYRVLLAPLLFGAGIKGKVLDAFYAHTPVLTTQVGAEGLSMGGEFFGEICDLLSNHLASEISNHQARSTDKVTVSDEQSLGTDAFVAKAIRLYQAAHSAQVKSTQAYEYIRIYHDAQKIFDHTFLELQSIAQNLTQHRKANWMGQILDYKQFRATEYFSRWIEVKNKLNSSEQKILLSKNDESN